MPDEPGQLTAEHFGDLVGETFAVVVDEATRLEATLIAVERIDLGAEEQRPRPPFSVVFRGPLEPELPQRIYRFEHAKLGALDIFVVPIARENNGVLYEAVFS